MQLIIRIKDFLFGLIGYVIDTLACFVHDFFKMLHYLSSDFGVGVTVRIIGGLYIIIF